MVPKQMIYCLYDHILFIFKGNRYLFFDTSHWGKVYRKNDTFKPGITFLVNFHIFTGLLIRIAYASSLSKYLWKFINLKRAQWLAKMLHIWDRIFLSWVILKIHEVSSASDTETQDLRIRRVFRHAFLRSTYLLKFIHLWKPYLYIWYLVIYRLFIKQPSIDSYTKHYWS